MAAGEVVSAASSAGSTQQQVAGAVCSVGHPFWSACLPVCLPACLSACLPVCLSAIMPCRWGPGWKGRGEGGFRAGLSRRRDPTGRDWPAAIGLGNTPRQRGWGWMGMAGARQREGGGRTAMERAEISRAHAVHAVGAALQSDRLPLDRRDSVSLPPRRTIQRGRDT